MHSCVLLPRKGNNYAKVPENLRKLPEMVEKIPTRQSPRTIFLSRNSPLERVLAIRAPFRIGSPTRPSAAPVPCHLLCVAISRIYIQCLMLNYL